MPEKNTENGLRKRAAMIRLISALTPALAGTLGQEKARKLLARLIGEEFCYSRRIQCAGGRPSLEGFIELPGGCSWAKMNHRGCTFCAFQRAVNEYTGNEPVGEDEFMNIFKAGHRLIRGCDEINIFTGGSFWDGIPKKSRTGMLEILNDDIALRQLNIESRPEYINDKNIIETRLSLRTKQLRVAIGLETADDHLRNDLLNKGISRGSFEKAANVLKHHGCRMAVYILLKPHRKLDEGAAIREAVSTIEYAKSCKADVVLLQAMMVMPGTASAEWHRKGEFRPPWLWSVISVINQTRGLVPVRLAVFDDSPKPLRVPENCERCTPAVNRVLDQYRRTLDPASLAKAPDCQCRKKWQSEISKNNS